MILSTIPEYCKAPATVAELCDLLERVAEEYYQSPPDREGNRTPTGEADNVRSVLRVFREVLGHKAPSALNARDFYACQQALLARRLKTGRRLKRGTVNKYMRVIRRVLKAAAHPMIGWVPATVVAELDTVPPLPFGRVSAPESERVQPVAWELVTSTMAAVPPHQRHLYTMLDLHWQSGMRPGELVRMRRSEITVERASLVGRSSPIELMIYRPWQHKTRHHGLDRNIFLGPEAQRIVEDRLRQLPAGQDELWPYTTGSYREAVIRINRRNEIPYWVPGQIRHSFGTRMRAAAGIDVTQVLMGHRHRETTEIYAQPDASAAIEAILRFG